MSVFENPLTIKTEWEIRLIGPDGKLKELRTAGNVITNRGKSFTTQVLGKYTAQPPGVQWLGAGTSAAVNNATMTKLQREVGTRVKGTFTNPAGSAYFRNVGVFGTNNPSSAQGIREVALWGTTGSGGVVRGTLLNRSTFAVVNKSTADTLQITTKLTVS